MDTTRHDELRAKVQRVYSEVSSRGIYYNSRGEMKFTFVGTDGKNHETFLDPVTSSAIVNGLVPKSGVIYRGGHGGGKTTLIEKVTHMLTGTPQEEIVSSMIRGNDDQNVNTLLATLRFGKLMTEGEEEVVWRNFVKSYVKIIDEVNRFPPSAQNALFEILNKGRVEFIDQVYSVSDFIVFATENPNDPGTYPLSRPFVDRFSFCVPAPQIPSAADLYLLAERPDDKLVEVDVQPVMELEEIIEARKSISTEVNLSADALIYTIYLTQSLSSCVRGDYNDKSHNELAVGPRCKGCAYDTDVSICKMTDSGLSGRAFLDFQRWGKAYAWLLNAFEDPENPEVQQGILQTIAPYLMYHRVEPCKDVLARNPYYGAKMAFLEDVVQKVTQNYAMVAAPLSEVPAILAGKIRPKDAKLWSVTKDLVVQTHFIPLIAEADKPEFREIYDYIASTQITQERFRELEQRMAFKSGLRPPSKNYLLSKALAEYRKEVYM